MTRVFALLLTLVAAPVAALTDGQAVAARVMQVCFNPMATPSDRIVVLAEGAEGRIWNMTVSPDQTPFDVTIEARSTGLVRVDTQTMGEHNQ